MPAHSHNGCPSKYAEIRSMAGLSRTREKNRFCRDIPALNESLFLIELEKIKEWRNW